MKAVAIRAFLCSILALLVFTGAWNLTAQTATVVQPRASQEQKTRSNALRVADFTATIGVNTHIHYTDGGYANHAAVVEALRYLGIEHVRDGVPNTAVPGWGAYNYAPVARSGFKFNLIAGGDNALDDTIAQVEKFVEGHPGSVVSIEGPNEVNNWPVRYQGLTGEKGALAFQAALYDRVKSSGALRNIPVYDLTSWPYLTGRSDFFNVHTYPSKGEQPGKWLEDVLRIREKFGNGRRAVITEVGYYTLPGRGSWGGVDELTHAKLTLNLILGAAKSDFDRIFLYQLLDAYPDPAGEDMEKHFGLFDVKYRPKPAAVAIRNLTRVLFDGGAEAKTFEAGTIPYGVAASASPVNVLLMQRSSGAYILAVWNEPDIWDEDSHRPLPTPASRVEVQLGISYQTARIFDPLLGTEPVNVLQNTQAIPLELTGHPLLIELTEPMLPLP